MTKVEEKKKVLFCCTYGANRSKTGARIYKNLFMTKYIGVGLTPLGKKLNHDLDWMEDREKRKKQIKEACDWADIIIVMMTGHKKVLLSCGCNAEKVFVLGIKDQYDFMDEELVSLIDKGIEKHLNIKRVKK